MGARAITAARRQALSPWFSRSPGRPSLKAVPDGLKIVDGSKRDLCYVYVEQNEAKAMANGRLTPLEGEELARRLARFFDDEAGLTEG